MTADDCRATVLAAARAALDAGVAEVPPGSHRGPDVDRYLDCCVRGGRLLRVRGVAWCAAFASWCLWGDDPLAPAWSPAAFLAANARLPPVGYRAAVSELCADARAAGAWRDVGYSPTPGDLCVMGRGGQDPRRGGDGHVAVVDGLSPRDEAGVWFWTIGGNETHAVRRTLRSDQPAGVPEPVLGFIDAGGGLG